MAKMQDLTGMNFGRWKVLYKVLKIREVRIGQKRKPQSNSRQKP